MADETHEQAPSEGELSEEQLAEVSGGLTKSTEESKLLETKSYDTKYETKSEPTTEETKTYDTKTTETKSWGETQMG